MLKKNISLFIIITVMLSGIFTAKAISSEDTYLLLANANLSSAQLYSIFNVLASNPNANSTTSYELINIDQSNVDEIAGDIIRECGFNAPNREKLKTALLGLYTFSQGEGKDIVDIMLTRLKNGACYSDGINQETSSFLGAETIINQKAYSFLLYINLLRSIKSNGSIVIGKPDFAPFYEQNGNLMLFPENSSLYSFASLVLGKDNKAALKLILTDITDAINQMPVAGERSAFINYLKEQEMINPAPVVAIDPDAEYKALFEQYGIGFVAAKDVITKYESEILTLNQSGNTVELNAKLQQAISEAATYTIDETDFPSSNYINTNMSINLFKLSILNAKKVISYFKDKALVFNENIEPQIAYSGKGDINTYNVILPVTIFAQAEQYGTKKLNISSKLCTVRINLDSYKLNVPAGTRELQLRIAQKTDSIPADIFCNTQGRSILDIGYFAEGNTFKNPFLEDAIIIEKPATDIKGDLNTNQFYILKQNGEKTPVLNYKYDAEKAVVSFSGIESNQYVHISETDGFPEPVAYILPTATPTQAPTVAPLPTQAPNNNNNNNNTINWGSAPTATPIPEITAVPTVGATSNQPTGFTDLPGTHWAQKFIASLVSKNILSGVGDGLFKPEDRVTREQFAKMLVETFGLKDTSASVDFVDVDSTKWYGIYIASAKKAGIINGVDSTKFGVGKSITRQDMAVMAVRAAQAKNISFNIVNKLQSFADEKDISDYAKDSVNLMQMANIISGVGNNSFAPLEFATRAQAAKIIYMLIQ